MKRWTKPGLKETFLKKYGVYSLCCRPTCLKFYKTVTLGDVSKQPLPEHGLLPNKFRKCWVKLRWVLCSEAVQQLYKNKFYFYKNSKRYISFTSMTKLLATFPMLYNTSLSLSCTLHFVSPTALPVYEAPLPKKCNSLSPNMFVPYPVLRNFVRQILLQVWSRGWSFRLAFKQIYTTTGRMDWGWGDWVECGVDCKPVFVLSRSNTLQPHGL